MHDHYVKNYGSSVKDCWANEEKRSGVCGERENTQGNIVMKDLAYLIITYVFYRYYKDGTSMGQNREETKRR